MSQLETPARLKELPLAIVKQSVALATAGFGVAVALAWNELIRGLIGSYVEPWLGANSGLSAQAIYALVVTLLAVIVTMYLVRMQETLEVLFVRREERAEKTKLKRKAAAKTQTTKTAKKKSARAK